EFHERIRALIKSVNVPPVQRKPLRSLHLFTDVDDGTEKKTLENVDYSVKYTNGMINFKDMYCIACAALLCIWANGWGNGMVCNDDHVWHNVYSKDAFQSVRNKLIRAVKCTKAFCGCSANYQIPKFASEEEAKKYVEFAQKRQAQLFDEYFAAHTPKTN
ncbi:MAG: hypothetical protein IJP68_12340, partial [Selenomonadaceae bacterium]|nr:hypothetical protein [Selenomonadaceae bacterium]